MDYWQMQCSSDKCVRAGPYKLSRWCSCDGIEMISNSSLCSSWLFFQFDLCESTHIIMGTARIYTSGCSSSHNAHGSLRATQLSSPQLSSDQLSLGGIEYKEQRMGEKERETRWKSGTNRNSSEALLSVLKIRTIIYCTVSSDLSDCHSSDFNTIVLCCQKDIFPSQGNSFKRIGSKVK